jgi:hypothetical protein
MRFQYELTPKLHQKEINFQFDATKVEWLCVYLRNQFGDLTHQVRS